MYLITKNAEPRQLTTSRNQLRQQLRDPDSDVMAQLGSETKRAIKTALLEEQRSVCCYCTGRISMDDLRVEHWVAQSADSTLRLTWSNLFAACHGNEQGEGHRRCDVLKENRVITLKPTNSGHLNQLRYTQSGEMLTDSEAIRSGVRQVREGVSAWPAGTPERPKPRQRLLA